MNREIMKECRLSHYLITKREEKDERKKEKEEKKGKRDRRQNKDE
jgi:hypothetical protein